MRDAAAYSLTRRDTITGSNERGAFSTTTLRKLRPPEAGNAPGERLVLVRHPVQLAYSQFLYVRRADASLTNRGDAVAATRIVRGNGVAATPRPYVVRKAAATQRPGRKAGRGAAAAATYVVSGRDDNAQAATAGRVPGAELLRIDWHSAGDVVMWDERATQHAAVHDYAGHGREMHRVLLASLGGDDDAEISPTCSDDADAGVAPNCSGDGSSPAA